MSEVSDTLAEQLQPFGLNHDQAGIYLLLLSKGEKTALEISRASGISRTRVYHLCQELAALALINITGKSYATKFKANSFRQLETMLKQKKAEMQALENSLPPLFTQLAGISLSKYRESQIVRYEGLEGLKQVTWNSTKAKKMLRVFEVASMSAFLDFDFAERVRLEFVRQGLKASRQLTNLKEIGAWTNVPEFVRIWECRYIDPAEIKTQIEMLIYNDVVAMYQYQRQQIFCLEIHDQDLANTQKQFYDFIWARANTMRVMERGAAKLENR